MSSSWMEFEVLATKNPFFLASELGTPLLAKMNKGTMDPFVHWNG